MVGVDNTGKVGVRYFWSLLNQNCVQFVHLGGTEWKRSFFHVGSAGISFTMTTEYLSSVTPVLAKSIDSFSIGLAGSYLYSFHHYRLTIQKFTSCEPGIGACLFVMFFMICGPWWPARKTVSCRNLQTALATNDRHNRSWPSRVRLFSALRIHPSVLSRRDVKLNPTPIKSISLLTIHALMFDDG